MVENDSHISDVHLELSEPILHLNREILDCAFKIGERFFRIARLFREILESFCDNGTPKHDSKNKNDDPNDTELPLVQTKRIGAFQGLWLVMMVAKTIKHRKSEEQ
jgi:hypothetical protein